MSPSKICRYCGKLFSCIPSRMSRTTYCSMRCMSEDYKERQKGKGNGNFKNAGWHICKICGVRFHSYVKTRTCCSLDCRNADSGFLVASTKRILSARGGGRKRLIGPRARKCVCKDCGIVFYWEDRKSRCPECNIKRQEQKNTKYSCVICGKTFGGRFKKTCSDKCLSIRKSEVQTGAKSHLWQGGRTEKSRRIRNSIAYQAWRTEIFERDDFACHICGKKGGKLSAHHIVTLSEDPSRILDTSNGITLCWDCHGSIRWHEKEHEAEFFAAIQSRSADEAIEALEVVK